MRMKNVCLSGLVTLAALLSACDSTVGLDPTRPTFTKVLVPGVCPLTPDVSRLRLSVLLLDGRSSLLPDSRIQREFRPVIELLPKERFTFSKSSADTDVMGSEPGVVVKLDGDIEDPQKLPTVLQTVDRSFAYAGGEVRQEDQRLVVLVMDHSGTLAGIDPLDGALKPEIRTDQRG